MAACICVYLSVKAANKSLLPTPSQAQFVFVQCSPVIYTTTMLNIAKLECLGERKKSSGVIESLNKEAIGHDDFVLAQPSKTNSVYSFPSTMRCGVWFPRIF